MRAAAASGTAFVSGEIFKPLSVIVASGSSPPLAMRLTALSFSSSSSNRSFRYKSQSVTTDSGN
jgi:hypothetical protein